MDRNTQKFPTGEVRIFEAGVLVEHVRAASDPATVDLIGTSIDGMPAPFEPTPQEG